MSIQTWSSVEDFGNGILVYRDALPKDLDIINRLEFNLDKTKNPQYQWQEAMVGYREKMPEYRDCYDFKFKKSDIELDTSEVSKNLQQLWQDVYDRQKPALDDYCEKFRIMELKYWEAFNFIKYGPNQHFMEHHDHGYSYNCTVSLVGYPNDDYEGGELYFRLQDLNIKPKAGDLYIFPSNYMYPHQAKKVISGLKYSIVTMTDYSSKFHTREMYEDSGN
jgi:hypothetical protein